MKYKTTFQHVFFYQATNYRYSVYQRSEAYLPLSLADNTKMTANPVYSLVEVLNQIFSCPIREPYLFFPHGTFHLL